MEAHKSHNLANPSSAEIVSSKHHEIEAFSLQENKALGMAISGTSNVSAFEETNPERMCDHTDPRCEREVSTCSTIRQMKLKSRHPPAASCHLTPPLRRLIRVREHASLYSTTTYRAHDGLQPSSQRRLQFRNSMSVSCHIDDEVQNAKKS